MEGRLYCSNFYTFGPQGIVVILTMRRQKDQSPASRAIRSSHAAPAILGSNPEGPSHLQVQGTGPEDMLPHSQPPGIAGPWEHCAVDGENGLAHGENGLARSRQSGNLAWQRSSACRPA